MEHEHEHESEHGHPHHFHRSAGGRGRGRFPGPPGFGGRPEFGGPGEFGGPRGFGMPPVPGMPPFPPGGFGPWAARRGRGRGGRARRGDVRAAALALLAEEPMNGYQIIQQIGERSGGLWRPSPGSVYPALQQLQDEGLVMVPGDDDGGRRTFRLTEAGREYVAAHQQEMDAPWSEFASEEASSAVEMRRLLHQLQLAAVGVLSAGTRAQAEQARAVLSRARRELYKILAEEDAEGEADE